MVESIPDVHGRIVLTSDTALNDSDKTITVPTNARWMIMNIHVELISGAGAGNRQIEVHIRNAVPTVVGQYIAGNTQAASLTYTYEFYPGAPYLTTVTAGQLHSPIPLMLLPGGYSIRIYDSAAIAAATDDLSIQMICQEWIEE